MFIAADIWAVAFNQRFLTQGDSYEIDPKADAFVHSFLLLHAHHLFYSFSDVESRVVFPELSSFDLRVVQ